MILAAALHQPAGFNRRDFVPDFTSRYEAMRRVTGGDDVTAATLPPGTTEAVLTGADESDERYYVRVYNRCNLPDRDPIRADLKRVAFDDQGQLILPEPRSPRGLTLVAGPGGLVTAQWFQPPRRFRPEAVSFNVYVATGTDPVDYASATLTASGGGYPIQKALGTFAHGTVVTAAVRAVSAEGTEEPNTNTATVTADAQAPDAIASFTLEVTPQ